MHCRNYDFFVPELEILWAYSQLILCDSTRWCCSTQPRFRETQLTLYLTAGRRLWIACSAKKMRCLQLAVTTYCKFHKSNITIPFQLYWPNKASEHSLVPSITSSAPQMWVCMEWKAHHLGSALTDPHRKPCLSSFVAEVARSADSRFW